MRARLPLPDQLLRERFMAILPGVSAAEAVAPVEILIQESVGTICLPVGVLTELEQLTRIFAGRACFGVQGVHQAAQADEAIAAGASFLCLTSADLVDHVSDAGVPCLVPALTPTEALAAWRTGASAVMVTPAEVLGTSYAKWMAELAPGVVTVPSGGVAPYAARSWLAAGSAAVGIDEALVADAFRGGSLANLRERAANLATIASEVA